jgi:hypothetical protein
VVLLENGLDVKIDIGGAPTIKQVRTDQKPRKM